MDWIEIARELIAIDATTGREAAVTARVEAVLRDDLGLAARRQPVAPGRDNLIAGAERPAVLFCTHLDTVPPHLEPREDAEHLWGRGACDTKGITAAFLEAGRRLLAEGFDDFGYLFVVGEEVDNAGARRAAESERARFIIVGEPTGNRLATGHRGAYGARVRVRGTAAHSARPELGDSAVHRLLSGLARVLETDFGRDDLLGPSSVNVGCIEGGVAHNVVAPSAEARLLVRAVGPLEEIERKLAGCFRDPRTGGPDPRVEIEPTLRMPVPRLGRIEGELSGIGRLEECVVGYGTDAPFLEAVGTVLLLGPGSIDDAHSGGEKVSKRELARAVEIYVALARHLAARSTRAGGD